MRFVVFVLAAIYTLCSLPVAAQNAPSGQAYHLSPEEQKKFDALTPEQRADLLNQANKKWQGMKPEEKKQLEEKARANFEALSPAEQQKIKLEALKQWKNLSPEQQQELRATFPDLLQGELEIKPRS